MAEIFPELPLTSLPAAVSFMGPQPRTLDVVEDELAGVSLSLYEEELLTERLRWALAAAKRGRARLRAQVAALLAERHETNESVSEAAEALRVQRDRIAGLEAQAAMACRVCEAPVRWVDSSSGGWWNHATPAEDGHGVTPRPAPLASYPPVMRWAALLDREDLADFLDELAASAITNASSDVALAEVETTCRTWRLIAEAQHGHNTAVGPDAMSQAFAPVAALREVLDGEHWPTVHHDWRLGRDLPELGGPR